MAPCAATSRRARHTTPASTLCHAVDGPPLPLSFTVYRPHSPPCRQTARPQPQPAHACTIATSATQSSPLTHSHDHPQTNSHPTASNPAELPSRVPAPIRTAADHVARTWIWHGDGDGRRWVDALSVHPDQLLRCAVWRKGDIRARTMKARLRAGASGAAARQLAEHLSQVAIEPAIGARNTGIQHQPGRGKCCPPRAWCCPTLHREPTASSTWRDAGTPGLAGGPVQRPYSTRRSPGSRRQRGRWRRRWRWRWRRPMTVSCVATTAWWYLDLGGCCTACAEMVTTACAYGREVLQCMY